MPKLFDEIRSEHANIAKVLRVLKQQVANFDQGENPDFVLMHDIVIYMADYPDQIHHPKEDIVYTYLAKVHGESNAVVQQLQADHKRLAKLTKSFADTLQEIMLGSLMSREQVSVVAHEFIDFNMEHLRIEEKEVFPRLMQYLSDADWIELADQCHLREDPLQTGGADNKYRVLYDTITKLAS